jgi:DNA-binding transcriptional LysR family regulator
VETSLKHHQLRALVAIAEHGTVRAAARAVSLSQPALTKAIRELEEDLGAQMVVRSGTGMQLTAPGERVYARASLILAEMRRVREDIEQALGGRGGKVTFGITPFAAMQSIAQVVDQVRLRMPELQLVIHDGFVGPSVGRLRDGSLDFLLSVVDLSYRPVAEVPLAIVGRRGHPLATARRLADLAHATWVLNTAQESFGHGVLEALTASGGETPRVVECTSFAAGMELSCGTDALAAVPERFLRAPWIGERLVKIPIDEPLPAVQLCVVTRRDALLTPACEYTIDCFESALTCP